MYNLLNSYHVIIICTLSIILCSSLYSLSMLVLNSKDRPCRKTMRSGFQTTILKQTHVENIKLNAFILP